MNIKKIIIVLIGFLFLSGCTKLSDITYEDIISNVGINVKNANVYRNGYSFYLPKGLSISDASSNYAIISSLRYNYYVYFDLLAFNQNKQISYEIKNDLFYSKNLSNGYLEIKKQENEKYLIEIMYNYAKIEVMVDEDEIKEALINSISILNSIKYDQVVIENLIKDDNLNYTEEIFDMFKKAKKNSDILNYTETDEENLNNQVEIKDTDFLN